MSDEVQAAHRTPAAQRTPAQKVLVADTARLVAVGQAELDKALSPAEREKQKRLQAQLKALERLKPVPLATTLALADGPAARTYLLLRGELSNRGDEVQPGYPVALSADHSSNPGGTNRRELADWLTKSEIPLTARVLVNRLWQYHFGRGLVSTPNDFGVRGQPPTHPELLDWLARELVSSGWSIKHMHRLILTSAAFQQSALASAETRKLDPDNRLWTA